MWHFKAQGKVILLLVMIMLVVVLSSLSSAATISTIYDDFNDGAVDGGKWDTSAFTDPYRKANAITDLDFFSTARKYGYFNYQMEETASGRLRIMVGRVTVYTSTTNGESGNIGLLWYPASQVMKVYKNGAYTSVIDMTARTNLKLEFNQSQNYNAAPPTSAVTEGAGVLKLDTSDGGLGNAYTWLDNVSYSNNLINYNLNYTTTTLSGSSEIFKANITFNDTDYPNINGYLIYNGTSYSSTKTGLYGNYTFTKTLTVPTITLNTNISFYWIFEMINSSSFSDFFNSSVQNQTLNTLGLDDCSVNTIILLNYTMKDERTQSLINGTFFNNSIEVDMQIYSSGSLIANFSKSYINLTNAEICISSNIANSSYKLHTKTRYSASSYVPRYNYLQNFLINNSITQNINLFDLQTAYATKFFITYKDSSFLAVPDALISINKFYTSEGISKTVEIEKTDYLGQATGYFDLTGTIYSIVVSLNGTIISNFNNIAVFCQDVLTQNCVLNLDESSILSNIINFQTYNNLNYQQSFNSTSRIYTLNFNTIDNSISLISINMSLWNMYANTTICSNQVSTSSGSLTCSVPLSYNNVSVYVDVYKDGTLIDSSIYTIAAKVIDKLGGNTLIFLLGIVMTIGVMFIPSAIGLVVATIIGLIFSIVLFSLSSSILGGAFMFIVVVAVIIIWRIRQGGTE